MLEPGIELPSVPDVERPITIGIDSRGWVMVLVAMVIIGVFTLRPAPSPLFPGRIQTNAAEAWMADALPGIGPKTRESMVHKIRLGAFDVLPARAQVIARQVFMLPAADQLPTGSSVLQAP
jgi:hypothetical protein